MLHFIDLIAEYIAVCPYYKPTKLTYGLVISFLIMFSYVFILPLIIFILCNPAIFILIFMFLSCYYLAEVNQSYEEYFD